MKPFQQVIDRIIKLADENPDRIADCKYFDQGEPCCIVGHVLAELGAVQDFDESVRVGDYTFPNSEAADSICWDVFDVEEPDPIEETFLVTVQELQDEGCRWGSAVDDALESSGI